MSAALCNYSPHPIHDVEIALQLVTNTFMAKEVRLAHLIRKVDIQPSHPCSSSHGTQNWVIIILKYHCSRFPYRGTRVFVRISADNQLEYQVKPLPPQNPHKTPIPNPLGRGRVLGKNALKFGENLG
jgi:hypothetical protein